jgi:hypothetical protein
LSRFVFTMLEKSFELDKPLPPQVQDIVDAYLEAKANAEEEEQAAQDAMMEQQAMQMQEGQEQQQLQQAV